jgi:hypothetical protein
MLLSAREYVSGAWDLIQIMSIFSGEVFSKMVSSTFGFMLSFPVSCLGPVQFPRHGIICNLVRVLLDPQEMAYNSKILDVKRN